MSQKDNLYSIRVGFAEPAEVERGEINRTTGLPASTTEKGIAVVGKFAIPNYSKVWAKRTIGTDNKPTGQLEFLPWGTDGGEVVEIRYLRNSRSLDKQYQDKQGLKPGQEDGHLYLNYGVNTWDKRENPLLIQMLMIHTFNGDSICRDPSNQRVVYNAYDENGMVTKALKEHEQKYECMHLVMSIKDNSKKLAVFARVFQLDEKRPDQLIITDLMDVINRNPGLFLEQKSWFQNQVQAIVARAADFGVVDTSINGEVHLSGDRNGPILSRLSAKLIPAKKLEYIVENCFEPDVFDAIERIKGAVLQKEQQLN